MKVAAIVEGHGELEAVPILIRRIAAEINPGFVPEVLHPIRVPSTRLIKDGELERYILLAAHKLNRQGGIIIIVDCDWDDCCPARIGPKLYRRATRVCPDIPIAIILAKMEYEAWFIAAAESLRGKRGLNNKLAPPQNPEKIRNAKGWLSNHMHPARSYSEIEDQPAFSQLFAMDLARNAPSFDKCYRSIRVMLTSLYQPHNNRA